MNSSAGVNCNKNKVHYPSECLDDSSNCYINKDKHHHILLELNLNYFSDYFFVTFICLRANTQLASVFTTQIIIIFKHKCKIVICK